MEHFEEGYSRTGLSHYASYHAQLGSHIVGVKVSSVERLFAKKGSVLLQGSMLPGSMRSSEEPVNFRIDCSMARLNPVDETRIQ